MKILLKPRLMHLGIALCAAALLLGACRSAGPEETPTLEAEAVLTAAAQTADARLTELALPTPTETETPLPPLPSSVPETPTQTQSTTLTPFISQTPLPNVTAQPGGPDQALYVADVTVPDSTQFSPGEAFTKTWRLSNTGTSTWTTAYSFVFIGGAQMSSVNSVPLTQEVAPGGTVEISVNMVAPTSGGSYRGFWEMRNADGELFNEAVYVDILVAGGTPAAPSTSAPGATAAPTATATNSSGGGAGDVTGASLNVDAASADTCPHTFTFTGQIILDGAATVTYQLEAGSDTSGFTYDLPDPFTVAFDAGTHNVNYVLDISDSVEGWAQLHVTEPNDVISNQVTFTLDCP